jgi:hypothetical protein
MHPAVSGTPAETLGIDVLRLGYDLRSQSMLKHNSVILSIHAPNMYLIQSCPGSDYKINFNIKFTN